MTLFFWQESQANKGKQTSSEFTGTHSKSWSLLERSGFLDKDSSVSESSMISLSNKMRHFDEKLENSINTLLLFATFDVKSRNLGFDD